MNLLVPFVAFLAATIIQEVAPQGHALFIRNEVLRKGKSRVTRQTNADQMVQNILQWLQGVYTQNSRRSTFNTYHSFPNITNFVDGFDDFDDAFRQGTLREYLPPSNTQKPRPFEPVSNINGNNGYPAAGFTPQPPFPYPTIPGIDNYPQTNEITPTGYPTGGPSTSAPTGYPEGPSGGSSISTEAPQQQTTGYAPSSGFSTEQPAFTTGGSTGFSTGVPSERPGFPTVAPGGYSYPTPQTGLSTEQPGTVPPTGYTYSTGKLGFPTGPPQGFTTQQPGYTTGASADYSTLSPQGFTTASPAISTEGQTPGVPTTQPSVSVSTEFPSAQGFSTSPPVEVTTGYAPGPESTPGFPTHAPVEDLSTSAPVVPSETPGPTEGPSVIIGSSTLPPITSAPEIPQSTPAEFTSASETTSSAPAVSVTTESPEINTIPTGKTPDSGDSIGTGSETDDDSKHPPHIHDIQVDCAKEMMTINIEFNRQFDGIIYSKGFYNNPDCRYVQENSGQTKYSFTVNLNTCGTEFVNAFDTEGKSYLQNVLVIQNEAGIQEVWDVIRSVRCLWEGSLKDTLSVALSVGMLTQEIVTFSGDTAMAKLDIQLGKGPFAPPADGLVKIGETMTLVVSVSGDPGFDLQVKDCRATDSTNENVVPLTDENGCVLKPKLFGAFQKTRNTGSTGASIIAYAFFSAFKFPDVMDLMIECNIELCKTDCEVCPEPNQKVDPGRRRKRDLAHYNTTLGDGVTMGKHIRVILPEDLSDAKAIINLSQNDGVCMSTQNFVFSSALLISLLATSCFFSAFLWLQNQRLSIKH